MVQEVKVCAECDQPFDPESEVEPLYECPECGESFGLSRGDGNGNRCPECGKFSAREGETHQDCNTSIEEAKDGWQCEKCNEVFDTEAEAGACECDKPETAGKPGLPKRYRPQKFQNFIMLRSDTPTYVLYYGKSSILSDGVSMRVGKMCGPFNPGRYFSWGNQYRDFEREMTIDKDGVVTATELRRAPTFTMADPYLRVVHKLQPVTRDELTGWMHEQEAKALKAAKQK